MTKQTTFFWFFISNARLHGAVLKLYLQKKSLLMQKPIKVIPDFCFLVMKIYSLFTQAISCLKTMQYSPTSISSSTSLKKGSLIGYISSDNLKLMDGILALKSLCTWQL